MNEQLMSATAPGNWFSRGLWDHLIKDYVGYRKRALVKVFDLIVKQWDPKRDAFYYYRLTDCQWGPPEGDEEDGSDYEMFLSDCYWEHKGERVEKTARVVAICQTHLDWEAIVFVANDEEESLIPTPINYTEED